MMKRLQSVFELVAGLMYWIEEKLEKRVGIYVVDQVFGAIQDMYDEGELNREQYVKVTELTTDALYEVAREAREGREKPEPEPGPCFLSFWCMELGKFQHGVQWLVREAKAWHELEDEEEGCLEC